MSSPFDLDIKKCLQKLSENYVSATKNSPHSVVLWKQSWQNYYLKIWKSTSILNNLTSILHREYVPGVNAILHNWSPKNKVDKFILIIKFTHSFPSWNIIVCLNPQQPHTNHPNREYVFENLKNLHSIDLSKRKLDHSILWSVWILKNPTNLLDWVMTGCKSDYVHLLLNVSVSNFSWYFWYVQAKFSTWKDVNQIMLATFKFACFISSWGFWYASQSIITTLN